MRARPVPATGPNRFNRARNDPASASSFHRRSHRAMVSGRWNACTGRDRGSGSNPSVNIVSSPVDSYKNGNGDTNAVNVDGNPAAYFAVCDSTPANGVPDGFASIAPAANRSTSKQVVSPAVPGRHDVLTDRHTRPGVQVQVFEILHQPTTRGELPIDLHPRPRLRRQTGRHQRSGRVMERPLNVTVLERRTARRSSTDAPSRSEGSFVADHRSLVDVHLGGGRSLMQKCHAGRPAKIAESSGVAPRRLSVHPSGRLLGQ